MWLIGCAVRAAGVWLFGLWCAGFFPRELRLAAAAVCSVGALALVTLAASATGVHGLVWWLFLLGVILWGRSTAKQAERIVPPWL